MAARRSAGGLISLSNLHLGTVRAGPVMEGIGFAQLAQWRHRRSSVLTNLMPWRGQSALFYFVATYEPDRYTATYQCRTTPRGRCMLTVFTFSVDLDAHLSPMLFSFASSSQKRTSSQLSSDPATPVHRWLQTISSHSDVTYSTDGS